MAPCLRSEALDPVIVQQAVSHLVRDILQRQGTQHLSDIITNRGPRTPASWTPAIFRWAINAAAQGQTSMLQEGWHLHHSHDVIDLTPGLKVLATYWEELLTALAKAGHVDILKVFSHSSPSRFGDVASTPGFLARAVESGPHSAIMDWLEHLGREGPYNLLLHREMVAAAALAGRLDVLQWLQRPPQSARRPAAIPWDPVKCAQLVSDTPAWQQLRSSSASSIHPRHDCPALCTLAAAMGDAATLMKLRSAAPPCPFDAETAAVLAESGETGMLDQLLQTMPTLHASPSELMSIVVTAAETAAEHGQLATLTWLWQHHSPSTSPPPSACVHLYSADSNVALLKEMADSPFQDGSHLPSIAPCNTTGAAYWAVIVAKAALPNGKLHVLEWLWDKCPQSFWQQHACDFAEKKSIVSLQWLLARDPPCSWEPVVEPGWETLSAIALHVHLPSPGLLAKLGPTPEFCAEAAEAGNLELLKYLRCRASAWDAHQCMMLAARNGHLHVMHWILSQEPSCVFDADVSNAAARHSKPHVLLWLLQSQPACPPPTVPEEASPPCLRLLVQWDCPMTARAHAKVQALGPLSPSLLIGLARWQRDAESRGLEVRQQHAARFTGRKGQQLLSHLGRLPDEVIMHICILAQMCRPLPG